MFPSAPQSPRQAAPRGVAGRAHALFLGAIGALLLVAAYQGAVLASDRDVAAVAMPGDGTLVGDLVPPPASGILGTGAETDVRIDIAWRADLRPLPTPPMCRLWVCDQEVPADDVEWLAGTASVPLLEHRVGDQQLVRVRANGAETVRLVRVREDGVTLRIGADVLLAGRVLDEHGEGVPGANLWLAGKQVRTSDDGRFELAVAGGEGLPLVVWADGKAAQVTVLEAFTNSSVRVVLQPGAQVRVRAIGAVGKSEPMPQVFVLPAHEPRTSAEAQYPFFLQALLGGVAIGPRGLATVSNLPLGGRFRLVVVHDRILADGAPAVEARARGTDVSVLLEIAGVVRGKVVRQDGLPVAGAWVATWPEAASDRLGREAGSACALPPLAYFPSGRLERSAADGSFHIARSLRRGPSRLVAAQRAWATEVTVRGMMADLEHDLTLPRADFDDQAGAASLRLLAAHPGRYRVRVVERGKQPRPTASWTGTAPFLIPLRSPAMADVEVTIVDKRADQVRALPALAIVDAVDLALPSGR